MFLDRCKVAQFPTDTSLPAILAEHAMQAASPSMTQTVAQVLDVYNDAANFALNRIHRQHVFDEIEGEFRVVSLVFVSRLKTIIYRCMDLLLLLKLLLF
jgi:hypothetical protein